MSLESLITLLPPPESLAYPPKPDDWTRLSDELGTGLPSDYVAFVETYGGGLLDEFLGVFNPATPQPSYIEDSRLTDQTRQLREHVELFEGELDEEFPYSIARYKKVARGIRRRVRGLGRRAA